MKTFRLCMLIHASIMIGVHLTNERLWWAALFVGCAVFWVWAILDDEKAKRKPSGMNTVTTYCQCGATIGPDGLCPNCGDGGFEPVGEAPGRLPVIDSREIDRLQGLMRTFRFPRLETAEQDRLCALYP